MLQQEQRGAIASIYLYLVPEDQLFGLQNESISHTRLKELFAQRRDRKRVKVDFRDPGNGRMGYFFALDCTAVETNAFFARDHLLIEN